MGADQLADLAGGFGAGLDGRPDAADIALDEGGDIPPPTCTRPAKLDVGRLEHGVGRLDHADQALGLDQAQGVAVGRAAVAADALLLVRWSVAMVVRLRRSWGSWRKPRPPRPP